MRVLFVTHAFPRHVGDAAGAFILRLATALQGAGHDVRVVAPAAPGLARDADVAGVPVARFRYAPRAWETLAYEGTMAEQVTGSWRGKLALAGMLAGGRQAAAVEAARYRADVIHAHWWFPLGVAACLVRAPVPVVLTLHGSDVRLATRSRLAPAAFRFAARRAAAVTAVSQWLAATAATMAPGLDVVVAPMPVDVERFVPGPDQRERRVLFVGRLNQQKGAADLLRALAACGPDVVADVVGDGPERIALEEQARAFGLSARLTWHGHVAPERVLPLYRRAAVVVVPSRDEGLGLVAVEAQLSETPVVAYRSGGLPDVVADGQTGILTPVGDTHALAAALMALLTNEQRARALGRAGRERLLARFSPAAAAAAYTQVYERVCTAAIA